MSGRAELRIWHDAVAQHKVDQMRARRRTGGVGGVTFVGSSQVLEGVAPAVAAPGLGSRAYNAALHRGFPPLTERWLGGVVLPMLRPRLVVLGLGVLDLTDTGTAHHEVVARFEASIARRRDWRAVAVRAVTGRSRVARRALVSLGPSTVADDVRVGPDGEGLEFATATEYRLSDKKRTYIEGELLAGYRTGDASRAALRRVAEAVRATDAEVVFVEMPHTAELVEMLPGGAPTLDAARTVLREVAGDLAVPLVEELTGLTDHRWFADCIHLNGAGMREASGILAEVLAGEVEAVAGA